MVNNNTTLSEINGVTGAPISPAGGFTGGGLSSPVSIAIDQLNNAWVVNPGYVNFLFGNVVPSTVSEFMSNGTPNPLSPFSGGGLNASTNASPRNIAFDGQGNFWIANAGGTVSKFSDAGVALAANGYTIDSASTAPSGVAVDTGGDLWVSGFYGNNLYKVSTTTGAVEFTSASQANGLEQPYSIAIDSLSNVWLPNYSTNGSNPYVLYGNSISEFSSSGGSTGVYSGGGISGPTGVAIDGAGNVWIADSIGTSYNSPGFITELNNNGTAISPASGYQGGGLFGPEDIAVDLSGNVWVTSLGNNGTASAMIEFLGAGVPTVTPLATAVATQKLGERPDVVLVH